MFDLFVANLDCLLWFTAGALSTHFLRRAWCKLETWWALVYGKKT